jgi:TRAP-type C4-dicarboxylate transport system substrate-binding protein
VVDGAENALPNIASSKLYEVTKFISLSAHKWECNPFLISQITWTRLPAADKEIIISAAKDSTDLQRRLMNEEDTKYLAEFKANPRLAVNEVDTPAFQQASAKVFEIWKAKPYGAFVERLVNAARA